LFIHLPKGLQEIMGSYQFNLINLVSYDLPHQFPESPFFNSIVRPKGYKIFSRVSKRGVVIPASRRAIEDCVR